MHRFAESNSDAAANIAIYSELNVRLAYFFSSFPSSSSRAKLIDRETSARFLAKDTLAIDIFLLVARRITDGATET